VGEHSLAGRLTPDGGVEQDLLWSFVGTVENAPDVRGALIRLGDERAFAVDTQRWSETIRWAWQGAHRSEADEAFDLYVDSVQRAKFVVCPRGAGLSSIRLFEAMEAARCPVIVSDDWLPPPFVEWAGCSISIPEDRICELPAILREREDEAAALGRAARAAWEEWFAPDRRLNTVVRACLDIRGRAAPSATRRGALAVRAAGSGAALRRARVLAREIRTRPARAA
jgi:hypothetical protein